MPVNTLYLNSDELFPEFAFAIPGTMGSTIAKGQSEYLATLHFKTRFQSMEHLPSEGSSSKSY